MSDEKRKEYKPIKEEELDKVSGGVMRGPVPVPRKPRPEPYNPIKPLD